MYRNRTLGLVDFVFYAFLIFTSAASSQVIHTYHAKQDSGANSPTGGTLEEPWRDIGYALERIAQMDTVSALDTVYLMLHDGPFHLASYDDSPLHWSGVNRPNLILQGEEDGTIITGVDSTQQLDNWLNPGTNYYVRSSWPADYDWDWMPFSFDGEPAAPTPPESYTPGPGLVGWIGWTMTVDSTEYDDLPDTSSHLGHWMIRREMLCALHRDTQAGTNTLRHFTPYPDSWIINNTAGLEAYHADFLENPETRDIGLRSDLDLSDEANNQVFVPALQKILEVDHVRFIKLKNLYFAFASGYYNVPAVKISVSDSVVVEDCEFSHIAGVGLSISRCSSEYDVDEADWILIANANYRSVYLNNVYAHDCGNYGISLNGSVGVTLEDCVTEKNNWLCFKAGTMSFACGGNKCYNLHRAKIIGQQTIDNFGYGWWIDQDGVDIEFIDFTAEDNFNAGLFLEVCPGPISVDTSYFANNGLDPDENVIGGVNTNLMLLTTRDVEVLRTEFNTTEMDNKSCLCVKEISVGRWDPLFYPGYPPDGDVPGRYHLDHGHSTFMRSIFHRYDSQDPPYFITSLNIPNQSFCQFFAMSTSSYNKWYTGSTLLAIDGWPPEVDDFIEENCWVSPPPMPALPVQTQ